MPSARALSPRTGSKQKAKRPITRMKSPLLMSLLDHKVTANVVDLDHYRIRGGMAVETDYIIRVCPNGADENSYSFDSASSNNGKSKSKPSRKTGFSVSWGKSTPPPPVAPSPKIDNFLLSKTFSSFRTLGNQLKKAADEVTSGTEDMSKQMQKVAQYCETVVHLVESQKTQYLGKVNYLYVKALAKKRSYIINEILDATLAYFPDEVESHPFLRLVAETIETFFLSDHCEEVDETASGASVGSAKSGKSGRGGKSSKQNKAKRNRSFTKGSPLSPKSNGSKPRVKTGGQDQLPFLDDAARNLGKQVEEISDKIGKGMESLMAPSISVDDRDSALAPNKKDGSRSKVSARNALASPVVPYTRKQRRRPSLRVQDDDELKEMGTEANLLLDDDRSPVELVPNYSRPTPSFTSSGTSFIGNLLENSPIVFVAISIASIMLLRATGELEVRVDLDIELLLIFSAFCIGLHTPRPMVGGVDSPVPGVAQVGVTPMALRRTSQRNLSRSDHERLLLVKSMSTTAELDAAMPHSTRRSSALFNFNVPGDMDQEDAEDVLMEANRSPMPKFPQGAKLGTHLNCYSEPDPSNFHVRGAKYLSDRKKFPSGDFIFPIRGVDLFLTDTCPENAGSNRGVFGGNLREKPTFIINFRLPWGVLLAYFEIPERFIPFIKACYDPAFDKSSLPSLKGMSPSDRCVARYLQASDKKKDQVLKIVPIVVEGPWIVKTTVGGKPAILGTKLPVTYIYQPAEKGKALYLEADLDIVSSSAARGILSVARAYTQVLTLDLGFVVQGNTDDELPEQMLVGTRLHGIDPISAPPFPPSKDVFFRSADITDSEESL